MKRPGLLSHAAALLTSTRSSKAQSLPSCALSSRPNSNSSSISNGRASA